MSITTDILTAKNNARNSESIAKGYEEATTYEIERYQKEYFYFMQKMHLFEQISGKTFEILDGIFLEIRNIKRVPNFAGEVNFKLFNFELCFFKNNLLLMMVTINPHIHLKNKIENGRTEKVIGVNCIEVQKLTENEDDFLSAVKAFKHIMENPDNLLSQLEESERKDYLFITSDHYYVDLTFLNHIEDMREMIKTYMENPSAYKPIITQKVEAPDYSKMTLAQLIDEFNKKICYEDKDRRLDNFCDEIISYFPEIEERANEIKDFFASVTDGERYIPDCQHLIEDNKLNQLIYNNGFSYQFRIYRGSSQMLINILKGEEKIGSLYYWDRKSSRKCLTVYAENMGSGIRGFCGLNENTIPAFMDALKNLSENWKDIITPVLHIYLKLFQDKLNECNQKAEEMHQKMEKAKKDFYKRQEEMEKYF